MRFEVDVRVWRCLASDMVMYVRLAPQLAADGWAVGDNKM
jgi:hypothetical protein